MELVMLKIDITIKELIGLKKEIKTFVDREFGNLEELDKNNINYILKKIVFLKYYLRQVSPDYRVSSMISDLLYLIRTIQLGEERYYYFNVRSIIEHSLRIINHIESTDTITNSEILKLTDQIVINKSIQVNLSLVKDEYSKSCLFVHGNQNSNMNLNEFYQSCLNNEGIINEVSKKLSVLVKLLTELFALILITQNDKIDAAFYRRKSILKYLLGEALYSTFVEH